MPILKKINLLFALLFFFSSGNITAQTLDAAIYMSQRDYVNSGRLLGTGNAMGAIGGDIGSININPASVASFRRSYGPIIGLGLQSNSSAINAEEGIPWDKFNQTGSAQVFLSNLGFIINRNYNQKKIKTFNFGLTLNRVSNFNENLSFEGRDHGSIAQRWVELANGVPYYDLEFEDPLELYPAFLSSAIDTISGRDAQYFSDYGQDDILNKEISNRVRGGITELTMSFGANLNESLLMGLNLSMPFFRYSSESNYYEYDDVDVDSYYESINFREFETSNGFGFNIGLGAIYTPIPQLKIGVSYLSPTWLKINREATYEINFQNTAGDYDQGPKDGYFDYNFTNPWRISGQVGFIIGKSGFISTEIDYLDYSNGKFRFSSTYASAENERNTYLKNSLGSAINLRAGGEFAHEKLRLRAGLGLSQSPYQLDPDFRPQYHLGFGFRGDAAYFDIAYRYKSDTYSYTPYTSPSGSNDNILPIKSQGNTFIATLGMSF